MQRIGSLLDPSLLAPFLLAVALVELTPGPNMAWLAVLAAAQGRAAGFAAVVGITLGLSIYMVAAVAGLTEVLLQNGAVYQTLRWAGVVFLLFLAWEAWRGQGGPGANTIDTSIQSAFWRGLAANLLNAKAALFYVVLLPTYMTDGATPQWQQAVTLGSLHIAVSILVHSAIVVAAAQAQTLLTALMDERGRWIRGAMAGAIVLIAMWTAWVTRSIA